MKYTIGIDYGTNSVRALLVNTKDGTEVASNVWQYESGDKGVIWIQQPPFSKAKCYGLY